MAGNDKPDSIVKVMARITQEISERPDILDRVMTEKPQRKSWTDAGSWNEQGYSSDTQVLLHKEAERKAQLKARGKRYKEFPLHLFPAHPDAPYMGKAGLFSSHSSSAGYTAHYLWNYREDLRGKSVCSQESLSERTYIALMARARMIYADVPAHRDEVVKIVEDIVVPEILERYEAFAGKEYYVRGALLYRCVTAMEEGFSAQINRVDMMLFQIFKSTVLRNGRKS